MIHIISVVLFLHFTGLCVTTTYGDKRLTLFLDYANVQGTIVRGTHTEQ